ncbi:MAG: sigma-54 dependent transcriptional regulator [Bacteroidota bacterium]|nr:sigma-54 dependent transcriptional regulator [Bacteroidota bacterium]
MTKVKVHEIINKSKDGVVNIDDISYPSYNVFESEELNDFGVFSKLMNDNFQILRKLKKAKDIPILVSGGTGTGKEVMAKYLHFDVDNNEGPYIAINCSNINKDMFEAELFGYNKGAFTGANKAGNFGYIEQAAGGTLFLDEVTEIGLDIQAKLLRVLQEREYYRLGGNKKMNVKCRIICATNRDILKYVQKGLFREDLYYRLNIVNINVPKINERKEEIIPLVLFFIKMLNIKYDKKVAYIEYKVLRLLSMYKWPGNIREIKNFITQIMIFIDGDTIKFEHLEIKDNLDRQQTQSLEANYFQSLNKEENIISKIIAKPIDLESFTKDIVKAVLQMYNGNKSKAAEHLGLKREQMYNRYKID